MSGKSRKKVFPKQPVKFHSKLEKDLGKWSNKVGFEASKKAIYFQVDKPRENVNERQAKELEKLKANLARRNLCQTTV